jgi:type IV secretory pathway VirB2 component (pilin)
MTGDARHRIIASTPLDPTETHMGRYLTALAVLVTALATAGTAAAGNSGNGAAVVKDAGCTTSVFATTCAVVKTVTNANATPSGKTSYVTNGTVERTITFVFGGSYTFTSSIHLHSLRSGDEVQEESDHYTSQWEYVSGTYHLVCVESYDLHWANDSAQPSNFELYCVPA